jgi:hypothetical protein
MPAGRSSDHYLAMLAKQRSKGGPFAVLGNAAKGAYRNVMKSEHEANLHMRRQLEAGPTYAKRHGRPENPWADWGQAVGSPVARGGRYAGRRAGKALRGMIR